MRGSRPFQNVGPSARLLCRRAPVCSQLANRRAVQICGTNFQKCLGGSIATVFQLDEYRWRAIRSQATTSPARGCGGKAVMWTNLSAKGPLAWTKVWHVKCSYRSRLVKASCSVAIQEPRRGSTTPDVARGAQQMQLAGGRDMWMRSCAVCKALLRKLRLCDSVRCSCGWMW